MRAATDERLMIEPPAPPCFFDMRFTASRAQRKLPVMLIANMRCMRSADISSTRAAMSTMPALFTSTVMRPSFSSTSRNMRSTSRSAATSPAIATAPVSRASASAAALLCT